MEKVIAENGAKNVSRFDVVKEAIVIKDCTSDETKSLEQLFLHTRMSFVYEYLVRLLLFQIFQNLVVQWSLEDC